MSKSGNRRPGSVKLKNTHVHWREFNLMRGGQAISDNNVTKSSEHPGDAEDEKLYIPESEPVQYLYDSDDLARSKIISFSFGLLIALVFSGIAAITVLSILGVSSDQLVKFLNPLLPPLLAIITFIAGYYFGKRGTNS